MIYKLKNKCKSTRLTRRVSLSSFFVVALLTVSCSDFSDYNTTPESQLTSGTSLWQNIVSHGSLNDFATLVQKSGLDINLKGATYYTVMAPLDGTYDMAQFMNADSAKATEQFVKQHIANYGTVMLGEDSSVVRTQNGKIHYVYPQGVTDVSKKKYVEFALKNAPANNGILHILKGQLPWQPNVYEYTDSIENCDSFKVYVKKYETSSIDEANSVQGPPDVNGKITYLDSTVVYTNSYYDERLDIRASVEDSIYTMVYLSNNAWKNAAEKLSPLYKYEKEVKYNNWSKISTENKKAVDKDLPADVAKDSIKVDVGLYNDSVYKYQMTRWLSFSMKNPKNKLLAQDKTVTEADDDTIVTTNMHRIPGGAFAIKENSVDIEGNKVKNLSNGYAYIIDKIGFKSWDTYNPYLLYNSKTDIPYYHPDKSLVRTEYISKVELAERDTLWNDLRTAGKLINKVVIPELFDERFDSRMQYVEINPYSSTKPSFCVALKNVLATTYRVIMVTVPPQIDKYYYNNLPTKQTFSFWLDYFDGKVRKVDPITPIKSEAVSNKFAYFDLGPITFPVCYYGLDAYPTLRVQCTKSEPGYESSIRLAGIILIPQEAVDFYEGE